MGKSQAKDVLALDRSSAIKLGLAHADWYTGTLDKEAEELDE